MGGPKNAFLLAKISPRGSKRLPKIKQNCVLAENLILLDAFLTIFVPVPFHDAFFGVFFSQFSTIFLSLFYVVLRRKSKNENMHLDMYFTI